MGLARAGRRVLVRDIREEFIKDGRFDTFLALGADIEGGLEDDIDPLACHRGRVHRQCVRQEIKLSFEVLQIGSLGVGRRGRAWDDALEIAIPFVRDEDDTLVRVDRLTDDRLVEVGDTLGCVEDDRDDVGTLDRALGA